MNHRFALTRSHRALTLLLVCGFVSACGFSVDNEERLARAEQALAAREYRAAVIDAKYVLREEPHNVTARLLLGRASIALGDAPAAEAQFRRAIELGIPMTEVLVDLGQSLLALQRFEAVVDEISPDLATTEEDRRRVHLMRGHAYLGLQETQNARDSFSLVLQAVETDIDALLGVTSSYVQDENFTQARATLDFVVEAGGEETLAWLASADLAMQMGDLERAESDYRRALEVAEGQGDQAAQTDSLRGLGNALLGQNELEEARNIASRLSMLASESLEAMELSARIAFLDQDWSLAQSNLLEILRQVPDHRPAQMLLGAAHLESGNPAQAEMYLSAYVAAVPTNADARRYLAQARYQMDKADSARETLQPLLDEEIPDLRSLSMAASASFAAEDFEHEVQYLRRAVEADPGNSDSQMALAVALIAGGKFEEAEQLLASLATEGDESNRLRLDVLSVISTLSRDTSQESIDRARQLAVAWPDSPIALNLAGAVEMSQENYAAARRNFEAALAIAPENLMSIQYMAALDEAEGDVEAAATAYRSVLEREPDDAYAMVSLARISAQAEDLEDARSWLEQAVATDGAASLEPRLSLGRLLLATGDFAGASDAADEALQRFAGSAEAMAIKGYAQVGLNDDAGAVDSFRRAVEQAPDNPDFVVALARAQAAMGQDADAARTIAAAYDPATTSVPIAALRVTQLMNSGDNEAAKRVAKDLQRALPDDQAPLALEAEVLAVDGQLSEALELYDVLLEAESSAEFAFRAYQLRTQMGAKDRVKTLVSHLDERPLDNEIRLVLAQAYEADGTPHEAIAEYEHVVEVAPENSIAVNNLAWLYFTQGDPRAEKTARAALALAPEDGFVLDTLGWILVNDNNKAEEGVELLESAVRASGHVTEIRYHLAVGLERVGRTAEARQILTEIVNSEEQFLNRQEAEELLREL